MMAEKCPWTRLQTPFPYVLHSRPWPQDPLWSAPSSQRAYSGIRNGRSDGACCLVLSHKGSVRRPRCVPIQSRACVLHICVAWPRACHRPHRWTTAEIWCAGRGWPSESKGQAHRSFSDGHVPRDPNTVHSLSCIPLYKVYICGVQPTVADPSLLSKHPAGSTPPCASKAERPEAAMTGWTRTTPGR
jgi:hypothetical protein